MPLQPPLSVGLTRIRENQLHQDMEIDAKADDAARHDLDGDEAEALATRHAEERRARREAAEHPSPEG
jgi:hypothetical protein